jgi:hypothetical protein
MERVFDEFPRTQMEIPLGDLNAKLRRNDILNRHLAIKVYTKLVMIMELH